MIVLNCILNNTICLHVQITKQRTFNCKNILTVQLFEKHMSGCCLVPSTVTTVFKHKSRVVFTNHCRVQFGQFVVSWFIAIKKTACLFGVWVQIQHQRYVRLVRQYFLEQMVNDRTDVFTRSAPSSVRVQAYQLGPAISVYDSVHIHHGDYFEHIIVELGQPSRRWFGLRDQRQ